MFLAFNRRLCLIGLICLPLNALIAQDVDTSDEIEAEESRGVTETIGRGVDGARDLVGGAFGLLSGGARAIVSLGDSAPPRSLAVMPTVGEGTDLDKADVRIAVHNSLGSTNFDVVKPVDIDRQLILLENQFGHSYDQASEQEIADFLGVDGLLFPRLDKIEKLYAAAYAHYQIEISVNLYGRDIEEYIWSRTEQQTEREGGMSLSPLSMLTTAISSAQVLSDVVRQALISSIAREIAGEIPQPESFLEREKPIYFELLVTNVAESPFKAGEEIQVYFKAEPGLAADFSFGDTDQRWPMTEVAEGEYLGSRLVQPGDNTEFALISVDATRVTDRVTRSFSESGAFTIDTIPPAALSSLQSRLTSTGVQLSWISPQEDQAASFTLERADAQSGSYETILNTSVSEFLDPDISSGVTYFYRVTPSDLAGNLGPASTAKLVAHGVGPTTLGGLLEGEIDYPAVGSPFILSEELTIAPGAKISFEAGSSIQLGPEANINVLGSLSFIGSAENPISISGEGWSILYDQSAAVGLNNMEYLRVEGANSSIRSRGSSIEISDSQFYGVSLELDAVAQVKIADSRITNAEQGLVLKSGRLEVQNLEIANNETGMVVENSRGDSQLISTDLKFTNNNVHIDSASPFVFRSVSFDNPSFEHLIAQLRGSVQIDWSSLALGQSDIFSEWIAGEYEGLNTELREGRFEEALARASGIRKYADHSGIESLHGLLLELTGESALGSNSGLNASYSNISTPRLWIQKINVSTNELSSGYALSPVQRRRLNVDYVSSHFDLTSVQSYQRSGGLVDLSQSVRSSEVLYSIGNGLLGTAWVLHLMDSSMLKQKLAEAGLVEPEVTRNQFALYIDNPDFRQHLEQLLSSNGVGFVSLSSEQMLSGSLDQSVNLLIQVRGTTSTRESGLAASLSVGEAQLDISLESRANSAVLGNWRALGNANDFGASGAIDKSVQTALEKVSPQVISAIRSADAQFDPVLAPSQGHTTAVIPEEVQESLPSTQPSIEQTEVSSLEDESLANQSQVSDLPEPIVEEEAAIERVSMAVDLEVEPEVEMGAELEVASENAAEVAPEVPIVDESLNETESDLVVIGEAQVSTIEEEVDLADELNAVSSADSSETEDFSENQSGQAPSDLIVIGQAPVVPAAAPESTPLESAAALSGAASVSPEAELSLNRLQNLEPAPEEINSLELSVKEPLEEVTQIEEALEALDTPVQELSPSSGKEAGAQISAGK